MTKKIMTKLNSKNSKKKDYDLAPSGGGNTLKAEFIGNSNKVRVRVIDQTCLDRLLMHDSISLNQYKTLDIMYSDFCKSGFVGIRASNYNPRVEATNDPSHERYAILRKKVLGCFTYVKDTGNKTAYEILIKVIHDKDFTKWEMNWIETSGNFDFICSKVENFYKFWGNS
jgi:hypothetical protein